MLFSRRAMLMAGAASAATTLFASTVLARSQTLGIGFLYHGNDSFDRDQSALTGQLGDRINLAAIDNLSSEDARVSALRVLIGNGAKMIIATHPDFAKAVKAIAPYYPDIAFELAGQSYGANVRGYEARLYEGLSVLGRLAGQSSRTGQIAYVAAKPSPDVTAGLNAFTLAARQINPGFAVRPVYASARNGRPLAGAAHGNDMVIEHAYGSAKLWDRDSLLASVTTNWTPHYLKAATSVLDRTWTAAQTWQGIDEGIVEVSVHDRLLGADAIHNAMQTQPINSIFSGPVFDGTGTARIAEGQRADYNDLTRMDWYVEGIGQPI